MPLEFSFYKYQPPNYSNVFIGTNINPISSRQPSVSNISSTKRDAEGGNESIFGGAKIFFSSLSAMTEPGSINDQEDCEQEYTEVPVQLTRYIIAVEHSAKALLKQLCCVNCV